MEENYGSSKHTQRKMRRVTFDSIRFLIHVVHVSWFVGAEPSFTAVALCINGE